MTHHRRERISIPSRAPVAPLSRFQWLATRQQRTLTIVIAGLAVVAACDGRGEARVATPILGNPPLVVQSGVDAPMPARVVAHTDTLHGVALPDPYRWLEDTLSAEGRAWVAGQEAFAANVLARVVGRDSLTALYERAFRDAPTLSRVTERCGLLSEACMRSRTFAAAANWVTHGISPPRASTSSAVSTT